MKLLHTADLHYCPEHADEALASLAVVEQTARDQGVDLIALAGDLYNRGIQASARDRFPELVAAIKRLLDIAPIVAVRGTVTHDVAGAYDALTEIRGASGNRLTMLEPGKAWGLTADRQVEPIGDCFAPVLLILGCPEPSKTWLLGQKDGLSASEATQAVSEAMRALLLGLGSIRREHPDIPCLMVYHGAIRGARMAAGQTVSGADLAIGAEDLALVGADYYALGHVHEAQRIGELPAYYAGSAYPCDWGERDRKRCWTVMVERHWPVEPPRIAPVWFPHPPRVKVVTTRRGEISWDDFAGHQVWLVVRDTPEELERVDTMAALAMLIAAGALDTSRVTIEPIPTETVRAAEITDAPTLAGKLAVYAGASGGAIPAGVLEKAEALEAEAHASGAVGQGAHIRLRRLRLRGAIGIYAGLGLDEVTLDLDDYERGLVALVGENGSGKSTLIENLHPYPELLTRGGSLQSHFRLKDSARELFFADEATDTEYRALILIDPTLSTPKAEYYLYRRAGSEWAPLTNGRKEDYVRAVAALWGSLDLFLRSAFVSQKPAHGHPDLADATAGERKTLFRELLGLDYLQGYAEASKARADELEHRVAGDEARAEALETELARLPVVEQALADKQAERTTAENELATIEERGSWARTVVEDLAAQVKEQAEIAAKLRAVTDEGRRLGEQRAAEDAGIKRARAELAGKLAAEAVLARFEALTKAKDGLSEQKAEVLAAHDERRSQYLRDLAAHRTARDAVQAQIRSLEKYGAEAEGKKRAAIASVDAIEERRAHARVTCPQCGATWTTTIPGEDEKLALLQEQVLGLDAVIRENADGRDEEERALKRLVEPTEPTLAPFADEPALVAIITELSKLDARAARETVRKADAAEADIKSAETRIGQLNERIQEIKAEVAELAKLRDETIPAKHAEAKREHERLQHAYAEHRAEVARLEAETGAFAREIEALNEKARSFSSILETLETAKADLADWRYLERACGRDGIQALELDAAGPAIASTANGLLEAADIEQRIEIRTTRMAGRGSKVKQVEDFEIVVRADGREQPLDTLSGGETVWIRKALYGAFGIIRARSTGTRFLTVCLDEADGALDPDAKRRYVAMLQAEHAAAGRAHTLVISHDESVQQAIGQRIDMHELATVREAVSA